MSVRFGAQSHLYQVYAFFTTSTTYWGIYLYKAEATNLHSQIYISIENNRCDIKLR